MIHRIKNIFKVGFLKKLLKVSLLFLTFSVIGYFLLGKIEYKDGLTYKTVIDNKIYSILTEKINDGKAFEVEYIEPSYFSEFNSISIEMDSSVWDSMLSNYTFYQSNREKFSVLENNDWRKIKLTVNDTTYNAKMKCHGKTPDGHFHENIMSLTVKFKKKRPHSFSKRMNLIIYKRLRDSPAVINYLSKKLNIHYIESKLFSVNINNGKKHLMHLEERCNEGFFKKRNLNNILICKKDLNKTFLINCLEVDKKQKNTFFKKDEVLQVLEKKISNSDLSSKNKKTIYRLNKLISNHETDSLLKVLNVDYFSRYEALRKIGGFTNHGFEKHNLLLYPDTSNGKLIMIPHRDHFVREIGNQFFFEKELLDKFYWQKHLFLECLVLNDSIRLKSYKHLYNLQRNKTSILRELDSIADLHSRFQRKSLIKKWFYHSALGQEQTEMDMTDIFVNNLEKIMSDLNPGTPEVIVNSNSDSTIHLSIIPNSLNEIKISGIELKNNHEFDMILLREYTSKEVLISDTLLSIKKQKNEDFKKHLKKISFFNKLDKDWNEINCTYQLKITARSNSNNVYVSFENMNIFNFSNNMKKLKFLLNSNLAAR